MAKICAILIIVAMLSMPAYAQVGSEACKRCTSAHGVECKSRCAKLPFEKQLGCVQDCVKDVCVEECYPELIEEADDTSSNDEFQQTLCRTCKDLQGDICRKECSDKRGTKYFDCFSACTIDRCLSACGIKTKEEQ